MKKIQFEFDESSFNTLFPYFILLDKNYIVKFHSTLLADYFPALDDATSLLDHFKINPSNTELTEKVTLSSIQTKDFQLIGQINSYNQDLLFIGTPNDAFISSEKLNKISNSNLKLQDRQEDQLVLLSLIAEKNINSVIICDSEGNIEWVNSSFIAMSEFSIEEVLGKKPGHVLQGKETSVEQINYLKNQIRNGLPFKCELINYKKSGEKYWVKIQGQALYSREGKILKYFAIEEDITKNIALKSQTEELASNFAKTNKDLESYALIASHDLKAPIRSIYSLITIIKDDNELNDISNDYLTIIENKLEKMNLQIEGILDYAQINKESFFYEDVNCNEIIKNSIENFNIPENIEIKILQNLPTIRADKYRLQQLFQKVICNALNFIDKPIGIVEIDYKEDKKGYIFSIKDNGKGVALECQKHLFDISKYFNNNNRSTGLGLSIAKKIVEILNGKIWIESELGVGTTFFIELKK